VRAWLSGVRATKPPAPAFRAGSQLSTAATASVQVPPGPTDCVPPKIQIFPPKEATRWLNRAPTCMAPVAA